MRVRVSAGDKQGIRGVLVLLHDAATPLFPSSHQVPANARGLTKRFRDSKGETDLYAFSGDDSSVVLFLSTAQIKYGGRDEKLKTLASRALAFAQKHKLHNVTVPLAQMELAGILAEGFLVSSYTFEKYKSKPKSASPEITVTLQVPSAALAEVKAAVRRAEIVSDAMAFARDLVNEPAEAIYPATLAMAAKRMAKQVGLSIDVLDEKALTRGNYGGIVGVGKGSDRPPRLIVLRYKPQLKSNVHLALVGKAVAFDTGGHSIKPAANLWEMKGDMAGGAAVLGAMKAIAQLKPAVRITAIVPSVINAIDSLAILPGDIIRSRSGKTVHIDNTDAEGRLILMDALDLAQDEGATHVVDVATLTGSVVRALGVAVTGIFGTDQELVDSIRDAGARVGENYWQMPLIDEYRAQLDHPIADMDNVGKGPNGGSITAALFLKEFVRPKTRWAHLDIAGTSMTDKAWKYFSPGATAVGVRTFVELAESLAEPSNVKRKKGKLG
ncbi:MAG: leucyl aminopeptidase [Candidatus Sumerlaeaceae bacterium]